MSRHLVLVGGGHAHLPVLLAADDFIKQGHRVTLVSPAPHHYYSGMGPGLLGGFYKAQQARFDVRRMVTQRGGIFLEDRVEWIEAPKRTLFLASGRSLTYDIASFNIGSSVPSGPFDFERPEQIPVKPIENLLAARRLILERLPEPLNLLVIGGGPAGVEIAGNLHRVVSQHGAGAEITLVTGRRVLPDAHERVRSLAMESLQERGVRIREGVRIEGLDQSVARLSDSKTLSFDLAFVAAVVTPSPVFADSHLPSAADGGLRVNAHLQSVTFPDLFGAGDCIHFDPQPLARVGVHAVRQSEVLLHNLRAALDGSAFEVYRPARGYMLILNMGDGTGVLAKGALSFGGKRAFDLKDYIDRRFMRRFQGSSDHEHTGSGKASERG